MRPPEEPVVDGGLQAERTALAWRRTALAMAVAAVGAGRLAAPVLGLASVAFSLVGLAQAATIAWSAERRYRTVHDSLINGEALSVAKQRGAGPIAALACSGVLVGVLALAFVLAA